MQTSRTTTATETTTSTRETKLEEKRSRKREVAPNKPLRRQDDLIQPARNKVDYVLQIAGEKQWISIW